MTTHDFSVVKGNTFDGKKFALSTYTTVANKESLPLVGTTVYFCIDTEEYWKWVDGEYVEGDGPEDMDLTGVTAVCQFKNPLALPTEPVPTLKVGTGLFIAGNVVGISPQKSVAYPLGRYSYSVTLTFPSGRIKTYVKGVMTVGAA